MYNYTKQEALNLLRLGHSVARNLGSDGCREAPIKETSLMLHFIGLFLENLYEIICPEVTTKTQEQLDSFFLQETSFIYKTIGDRLQVTKLHDVPSYAVWEEFCETVAAILDKPINYGYLDRINDGKAAIVENPLFGNKG